MKQHQGKSGAGFLIPFLGISIFTVPGMAEMKIVEAEAQVGGTVHIVFEDTDPPSPYTAEILDPAKSHSPWSSMPWIGFECVQPARFQLAVPGSVDDPAFYRVSTAAGLDRPHVIASDPANGAMEVTTSLDKVSISFDRPMAGTSGVAVDANWGTSYTTWSADHRTVEIHRLSVADNLPSQATLVFHLNPEGRGFADEEGRVLAPFRLAFNTGTASVAGAHVISSIPRTGATGVDPFIDTVEFHFSEPMMATGGFVSSGWWPWTLTWSADGLTAYVRRGTAGTPLYGHTASLSPFSFRSATGEPLAIPFTLKFTTMDPPAERVEADPSKGFYWPYYLFVPSTVKAPRTLLVEPNNTGNWGDDPWFHEEAALALLRWRSAFAVELGCPLLIPVFPRPQNPPAPEPGGIYVHALDRYSLSGQWPGLQQIDLQMMAMIDDALQRLSAMGQAMDRRIFMMGFSASGSFTSRFAMLHPDRVKAAACGSPGGWPMTPVSTWQGTPLKYPFGIQDFQGLTGKAFDLAAFKQVAFYIYVGGSDYNDALDFRGLSTGDQDLVKQLLNYPADRLLAKRWPIAEAIFDSVGADATFVIYPGVAHGITEAMFDDLLSFFEAHR